MGESNCNARASPVQEKKRAGGQSAFLGLRKAAAVVPSVDRRRHRAPLLLGAANAESRAKGISRSSASALFTAGGNQATAPAVPLRQYDLFATLASES